MDDAGRRKALLRKGAEVAKKLEDLLADKEVDLSHGFIKPLDPDEDDELRLRRFLEQIDRCIKRPRFGFCVVCDERLTDAALDEAPWTERCARHSFWSGRS